MRMFNLIETLSNNSAASKEDAIKHISKLDMFRFDSNNIINTVGQLINCVADGEELKPNEAVFRDVGTLLQMLSELNSLCDEQMGYYKTMIEEPELNQGAEA